MSDFIWPATAFLTTMALSLIFRVPLADMIQRIKSVSREGFHTGDDPARGTRTDSHLTDQVATLRKEHLEEIQRIAQSHEDREDKAIQPLQRQVAELAELGSKLEHRLDTIETNRVIKPMLAAPPLKQSTPK